MSRISLILSLAIVVLLNCCFVQADVFDKWVTNGENITVGDTNYGVETTEDILILREINESGKVVMRVNSTKTYDNYFFSNTGVKNSLSDYLEKHDLEGVHGSEEETNTFMHKLEVVEIKSQLKIQREIKPSEPYIFDRVEIFYSVENTGNKRLGDVVYREEIPVWLKPVKYTLPDIDDKEPYFSNKRKIKWNFNLDEGETKRLRGVFDIVGVPRGGELFKLNRATATYDSPDGPLEISTDRKEVEVLLPFENEFESSYEEVEYGEEFDFGFSFSNKHSSENLEVEKANMKFCEHLHIDEMPNGVTKVEDKNYELNNIELEPEELSAFTFTLKSTSLSKCPVNIDWQYTVGGAKFSESKGINVTTATEKPKMDFSVEPISHDTIRGGDRVKFSFMAENNNEFGVDKAVIELDSDIISKEKFIYLSLGEGARINNNFTTCVASLKEDVREDVYMNVTLVSESGSKAEYRKEKRFSFQKGLSDKILDITADVVNVTNNTYIANVNMLKLTEAKMNNLSIRILADNDTKSFYLSGEELAGFRSSGDNIKKPFNFSFKNNSKNGTVHHLNFTAEGFVDGRHFSQEESFVMNGSDIRDLSEVGEKKEKKQKNSKEVSYKKEEETYGFFNLSNYIVIGMIVMGLVGGIFFFLNRDASGVSKYSFKEDQKSTAIPNDLGKGKSKSTLGLSFDELQNDAPSNEDATMKQFDSTPDPNSDVSVLESYINERISNGDSKDKIKKDLKKKGWLDDILDVFLK